MQAVIFTGIQGAGKTTFYREWFFDTHVRINLDMLRTRHREELLLRACLAMKQPFVVDNTNPTAEDRARYATAARAAKFSVVCYLFEVDLKVAMKRNEERPTHRHVPLRGLLGTRKRLERPDFAEGFDAIYAIEGTGGGAFRIEEWVRPNRPTPVSAETERPPSP